MLRSKLKGVAFDRIETLDVTEDNYENCWEALNKTFDNPRRMIETNLEALINDGRITEPRDTNSLNELMFDFNGVVKNLLLMKVTVVQVITYLAIKRLDPYSRARFEDSLDCTKDMPTELEFRNFLDKESIISGQLINEDSANHREQ